MAYLRIHCGACGGAWEVYHKQREYDPSQRCPHCDCKIDPRTWHTVIMPAYNSMKAANMALLDDHTQYHCPHFEVDFIADTMFQSAQPRLDELGEQMNELQGNFQALCDDLRAYVRNTSGK